MKYFAWKEDIKEDVAEKSWFYPFISIYWGSCALCTKNICLTYFVHITIPGRQPFPYKIYTLLNLYKHDHDTQYLTLFGEILNIHILWCKNHILTEKQFTQWGTVIQPTEIKLVVLNQVRKTKYRLSLISITSHFS